MNCRTELTCVHIKNHQHRQLKVLSVVRNITIQDVLEKAVDKYLSKIPKSETDQISEATNDTR